MAVRSPRKRATRWVLEPGLVSVLVSFTPVRDRSPPAARNGSGQVTDGGGSRRTLANIVGKRVGGRPDHDPAECVPNFLQERVPLLVNDVVAAFLRTGCHLVLAGSVAASLTAMSSLA